MKIRLKTGTVVPGTCIPMGEHLIRVVFPEKPELHELSDMQLLNDSGRVFGSYSGYDTIYQESEDGSIILSNDGSIYTEPDQIPEPKPYIPTLDELKVIKKHEISNACEKTIYSGIDVSLPSGIAHFSLTEKDQINLFGKQAQLNFGITELEYHEDGKPCRYFTVDEMNLIIENALSFVSYHTTYCNSLNMWIAGASTSEEVNSIYYGAIIPYEYQSEVLRTYLIYES